jgi:hypothetical protein
VKEFAKAGETVGLPAEVSWGLAVQTFFGGLSCLVTMGKLHVVS